MRTRDFSSPHGRRLACRTVAPTASGPTFVWLCGFQSDITGSKVRALEHWATAAGHGCLAFDYSGHGASDGEFTEGTLSTWREDSLDAIDGLTRGPLVLVGSSMGGWIALLAALARPERVAGLLLVAPAADFTEALVWPDLSPRAQAEVLEQGATLMHSEYGPPYPLTRGLFEDGRRWLLLDAPIPFPGPVRILQGMRDPDVPWRHALRLVDRLVSEDVVLTLIRDGDHRLSGQDDIQRLLGQCAELAEKLAPQGRSGN